MNIISRIMNFAVGSFTIGNILAAVIAFAIGKIAAKYVMKLIKRILAKSDIDQTIAKFIDTAAQMLVYFVLVVIVADCLNISIVSFVAVFSVAGLAVSLAAENSLSNLAGVIVMLIIKPFKVGDFVEASGNTGKIEQIGLIYTEILTADNKHIFIPNKDISSTNIINYSTEPNRRVDLKFGVSYDSDVNKVKKALNDAVNSVEGTLDAPKPFIKISNYKDNYIEYTVRVWCRNDDYWDVYFGLVEAVKPIFDERGIEFTYNHMNVHIIEKKMEELK